MSDAPRTLDDILGPPPRRTLDDILGPAPEKYTEPLSGAAWDDIASGNNPIGHVLNDFGHGVKQAWGATPGGVSKETEDWLRHAGIWSDHKDGHDTFFKTLNEAAMRPAAVAINAAVALGTGVYRALGENVPGAGAFMEAFPVGHLTGFPHAIPTPQAYAAVREARALRVIGEGEAGWSGTVEPTPATAAAQAEAVKAGVATAAEEPGISPAPLLPSEAELSGAPADIHAVAREVAPDVFAQFDPLVARQSTYQRWLDELAETRRQMVVESAPHTAQIADLERRIETANARMTKIYQARLEPLVAEHDAFVADAIRRDTPDMAQVRQELQRNDYQMRDLAPQVSAAYRQASERMPPVEDPAAPVAEPSAAPAETPPAPQPVVEPAAAAPETLAPTEVAAAPRATVPDIAADVSQKLVAAGRPVEEADAAAALVAAHYETRAARFGGARGTGAEMYAADAPNIVAATGPGRAGAAGSTVLRDGQATINLFGRADASTFIHETGHQWLDEMVRDAGHDLAPPDLKADAATVRRWLGAEPAGESQPRSFTTSKGSTYEVHEDGTTTRNKSYHPEHGPKDVGLKARSAKTIYVDSAEASSNLSGAGLSGVGPKGFRLVMRDGKATLVWENQNGQWGASASTRDIPFSTEPGVGKYPVEMWSPKDDVPGHAEAYSNQHAGNAITEIKGEPGAAQAPLTTRQHEKFARGFERYMMEGTAPSRALAGVFAKFREWLTAIYQTVAKLRAPITDDIRQVFDRMLATAPERTTIAPERAPPSTLADLHEASVATTPPARAGEIADSIRAESEAHATQAPEVHNELGRGADEAGRGAAAGGGPDGNEPAAEPDAGAQGAPAQPGTLRPSGGQITAPGVGVRAAETIEVPKALLARVPKEPLRLTSFLARAGGLRDPNGEISQIIGGPKGRPGLIRNQKGINLDDATLLAWEEGYFPEHGADRPTIQHLIDAIDEDVKGRPRYSAHHDAEVRAYQDAIRHNSEVERVANEIGIDAAGLSHAEFWDAVAERVSADKAAQDALKMSEDFEASLAEADARAKAHMGDAWEPDLVYDEGKPRTVEDLEREHREREAAAGVRPSDDGAQEPARPAGADQGNVQAGGGPGGRGAGADGRAGTQETAGPNAPIPGGDSGLIDKAGNIRLDNLNTPEDVNVVLREAAEQNEGFIVARRGVISDAEVLALADALGMDPKALNARKIGEAFNAEQVIAARKLLIQSAVSVRDAMGKAATGSDADVLAYAAARDRHMMIQEQVSGLTAEAGRALRAFRSLEGQAEATQLSAFLEESTGRTLYQLRREAQLGMNLDTPQKIGKFLNDAKKPSFLDMAVEFWINSLLSGPKTHLTNILSNSLLAIYAVPETALAAGIGAVRDVFRGGSAERVALGEAGQRLFALAQGAKEGIQNAAAILKDEALVDAANKVEQQRFRAIPSAKVEVFGREMEIGGKQIRIPGRLLAAEDAVFKGIAYRQEINALAYRVATAEGIADDRAFAARVADLTDNPSEAMMTAAGKNAVYQTFNQNLGATGRSIQSFANSHPIIRFVIPFIRTPVNIVKYAGERSLLGVVSREVRSNLFGVNGEAARDTQIARMTLGTSLSVAAGYLAAQGLMTGGGPTDPAERAVMYLTGWQPYSIKIGGGYYSIARMEPLGTLLGVAADMYEVGHAMTEKESHNVAAMALASISKNLTNKTWLSGPSSLIQAVTDPDRYGEKYIQGLVGSVVPAFVAQAAQVEDPYLREARTVLDGVKARIPGVSESLLPKRDIWGNAIPRVGVYGPIASSAMNDDPVNQALLRLQYFPSKIERTVRGVTLTDQQYDDLARTAGRMAKMRLDQIVAQPSFAQMPSFVQHEVMKKTVESSRHAASALLIMENPSIMQTAVEEKKALISGAKPSEAKEMLKHQQPSPTVQ